MDTDQVFGVSTNIIGSYIEREQVNGYFQNALSGNKQIVIYGSTKQGKTSLINKHLSPDSLIKVNCSLSMNLINIYSSILRQYGVHIESASTDTQTTSTEVSGSFRAKIKIPFLASAEAEASGKGGSEKTNTHEYRFVEYDLSLAQDISEILQNVSFSKYVVLENFHYLRDEVQKNFAMDLRIFQETGIRFIILGIWRQKNKLYLLNGDLQDRIIEVAVEPWEHKDFERVVEKGAKILNVDFSSIYDDLITSSFDSIGVFQELCKECCLAANVLKTSVEKVSLTNDHLRKAIEKKLEGYSSRHIPIFETFINSSSRSREGNPPLYLHYYFLAVLLQSDFNIIHKGFTRKQLLREITEIHHRKDPIRHSDMGNFLNTLAKYQIGKGITPPVFDYDSNGDVVKIMDSTLYFFLRNSNREQILERLTLPQGLTMPENTDS